MLSVECVQLSETGPTRQDNEDYVGQFSPSTPALIRSHGWLFVLADGVGGHEKGEVASHLAVETVLRGFESSPGQEPHATLLPRLIREANSRIYGAGRLASDGQIGMATTIVACSLRYDRAFVSHVGDSRCYLVRRGRGTVLTRDHTLANEHVRMGVISAEEGAAAAARHVLSRSLGTEVEVKVDSCETQIQVDDILVLCSDGLHGSVDASGIASLATSSSTLDVAAQELVKLANQRDGSDNVSVQLIRIRSVEPSASYRGRPYSPH